MNNQKRKVCFVVHSRANYGRIKSVLQACKQHELIEPTILVGASALLDRFGNVREIIERDGFNIDATIYSIVEGETPVTMAKSTGMAIMELATHFENISPDIVVTVADRFETMATAIAASYMNIPLAHTQGGEITGSIDESVRHAITKLAHIHFPATKLAAENVVNMGERLESVFWVGCPAIDAISNIDLALPQDIFERYAGVGPSLDPKAPYLVVLQHPVTTEYGSGLKQIQETLDAVSKIDMQTAWLWPNVDAGSDDISKGLRMYREKNNPDNIHFYKNFSVEDYARVIKNCSCLVGNSSSALREGAFLGVPAVSIGTRQSGREHGENVIHAGYNSSEIQEAIRSQLKHGPFASSQMYGDGLAGVRMAQILATADIKIQKQLEFTHNYAPNLYPIT